LVNRTHYWQETRVPVLVNFITNKSMVLVNRTHYWQETRVPVLVKLLELV